MEKVREILSMYVKPNQILLAVTLDYKDEMSGRAIVDANNDLLNHLCAAEPRITRFFVRADGN